MRCAAALGLVVVATTGCESTQQHSARLQRAASHRPAAKAFTIAKPNRAVAIGRATVLRTDDGVAVVVPLTSRAAAPLGDVPLSFEVVNGQGSRVYRNDAAGLDASLVRAPLLERGRRLLWVDDQVQAQGRGLRARAVAGAARTRVHGAVPRMDVGRLRLASDGSLTGSVRNTSAVEQKRLVVFITARRGSRVTAAARAVVPRLKARATARFTAFPIGDARHATLSAAAPATTLP